MTTVEETGGLSAIAQSLLEGVLEKDSVDDAVRQIYDNMFQKTGWKYNASIKNTSGPAYINGTADTGMCESYRNAFAEIVSIYDDLRAEHPEDAVKNGTLTIELGNDLSSQRFATRRGLTLMGDTALKGNVYLQVDYDGTVFSQGLDAINTFVFYGHWTLKVNGKVYDPIFYSIDEDNVETRLSTGYADGSEQYLADTGNPIPTGEFGATFVHVFHFPLFLGTLTEIEELDRRRTSGFPRLSDASAAKKAHLLFAQRVQNRTTFAEVVDVAYRAGKIPRAQKKAFDNIYALL
jgi:hypothetical protein